MRLPNIHEAFARRLSFPADRQTVLERVGDVTLEAPGGDDTTVGAVLASTDAERFDSADELCETVVAFVGDAFIGRKFYDDRGEQTGIPGEPLSF
jgi:hypothetical protein